VTTYHIKCPSPYVEESEKLILDPHLDPDKHQNLTTARAEGHSLVRAYVFANYLTQNDSRKNYTP